MSDNNIEQINNLQRFLMSNLKFMITLSDSFFSAVKSADELKKSFDRLELLKDMSDFN